MSGKYGEPWTTDDESGRDIYDAHSDFTAYFRIEADAQHAVECVNACSGMDDPQAEVERLKTIEQTALGLIQVAEAYDFGDPVPDITDPTFGDLGVAFDNLRQMVEEDS